MIILKTVQKQIKDFENTNDDYIETIFVETLVMQEFYLSEIRTSRSYDIVAFSIDCGLNCVIHKSKIV